MKTLDERAYSLLKKQIEEHYKEKCSCDLRQGSYGLCYAGQWLESVIDSLRVIEDLKAK